MASIKVVLRSKTNKEGEHPLVLQFIKDRKNTIISLGHYINKKDWDSMSQRVKRTHPNHTRLNNLILKKLAEANDKLLELEVSKKDTTAKSIKNTIVADKEGTFLKQAAIYLEQLKKAGKFNRYDNDSPKIQRVKEFAGGDIAFSAIDVPFLRKFQAWLKGTRGVTDRTVANHLVIIRSIYNQAIEANLVDRKHYPFGKGRIAIKFPESLKIGLSEEEITALEQAELPEFQNHARNLFLISFYFAGMRISDVLRLKWSDFQNDRLYYTMGKNTKGGSLKVPTKAIAILDQYRTDDPVYDLVFPDLKSLPDLKRSFDVQRRIKTRVRENNVQLGKIATALNIKKKLTMHIARHSFAQIASDKIPVQILQKLYRHSNITTTIGYQSNFTTQHTDDALDKVLGS
jgi:integrase